MATVAIARPLLEDGLTALRREHHVHLHEPPADPGRGEDHLIAIAREADALITTVDDPVSARVIAACDHLPVIAQYGVGVDNIDLDAAAAHDIIVTNTPGVLTDATADFTWALLLAVARHVTAADAFVRAGRFERWETTRLLGMELHGKTMGIVGLGRIGAAVARRALGFGMRVVYHNRRRANPTVERETSARYVDLDTLLATSDVVSLHCPLNADSHHLIDADALARMKSTALLINTARGPVVDEAALADALATEKIAGAGLDVFEEEPSVQPSLLEQERVVLAPHLASATTAARTRMGEMASEAVLAVLAGAEKVPYRVV